MARSKSKVLSEGVQFVIQNFPSLAKVGETYEYSVKTIAGTDVGKMAEVQITYDGMSREAGDFTVEYKEVNGEQAGQWLPLLEDRFGPPEGFPISDITADFRVTFKKQGSVKSTFKMVLVEGEDVLAQAETNVTAVNELPTISINGLDAAIKTLDETQFTVSTSGEFPKESVRVKISSDASEDDLVLYYKEVNEPQAGQWLELKGGYFGAPEGFPFSTISVDMKVVPKVAKKYNYTLSVVTVKSEEVICSTEKVITVIDNPINPEDDILTDEEKILLGTTKYTVMSNDTLYRIASRFGTSVNAICKANNFDSTKILLPGEIIIIPGSPNEILVPQSNNFIGE